MPIYPTSSQLDGREEGRQGPKEGQAPLFTLFVVASLLVLTGFFIGGDSAVPNGIAGEPLAIVTTEGKPPAAVGSATTVDTVAGETSTTTLEALVHPIRQPSWIVIPSIRVSAPVVSVGLLDNGDMETPRSGDVGWYSLGPAPGEQGPAVMLAHVDTYSRPDVFYHLKDLKPGDEISVYGASGDPAVFVVESVDEQLKIDLPRDRIWSYTATALIRLITCGGKWDSRSKHYLSNVIVYGHLVR